MSDRGKCLWCTHKKAYHDGGTSQAIKEKPEFSKVKWTPSSCSHPDCRGCRQYES